LTLQIGPQEMLQNRSCVDTGYRLEATEPWKFVAQNVDKDG